MGQVLIRNVDDEVLAGLKVRARLAGVSFETFLRERLRALAPLSGDEKVALIAEFHQKHGPLTLATAPEEVVGEARATRLSDASA